QVTNTPIEQNGSQYSLNVPANRPTFLFAVEDSAILQSPAVIANNPSTLVTSAHNGNLVIITHTDFMTQAQAWATYRRTHDQITVEVVDIADIYDEFNYGIHSATPLFSFLNYAKNN